MHCAHCGHENPENGLFCSRCGARLREATSSGDKTLGLPVLEPEEEEEELDIAAPRQRLEKGSALLVIKKGPAGPPELRLVENPDVGMSFTVDRDRVSIGRHPESDIFLDDITVSRRHAEIRRQGDGFLLTDTGSLNGTYLNRERIESAPLLSGDEIQVGKYKLLFYAGTD